MMPPASSTSLPQVRTEQFEGPLDLLMDEVRQQNVAIEEIAMAPIVARFLAYVRTAAGRSLILDIEWLHMAATLIHWKSQVLLPADATGLAADPIRDSLILQLLAHRRQAAAELARRLAGEEARFSRAEEITSGETTGDAPEPAPFVSVWDLIQQAREISRWSREYTRSRPAPFVVEEDGVGVGEMMDYLRSRFDSEDAILDGARLIREQPGAGRKGSLFLGMLEMVRDQQLQMEQNEEFGAIWLRLRCRDNAITP